jgi:hypothetical protein
VAAARTAGEPITLLAGNRASHSQSVADISGAIPLAR